MKDAISRLKRDHSNVKKLFRKFEKTEYSNDAQLRIDLFRQIHDEIMLHTQVEEAILYPALEAIGTEEADGYHEEAHEEHEEAKSILNDLSHLDSSSEHFWLDMGKVIQGVEHHIKEEEEKIFPLLKRYLPKKKLQEMGERIEERKTALA